MVQNTENDDKMFIYFKESGNIPCKINGGKIDCNYNGHLACGIAQALPCQKLTKDCKLSDYACQDRWFTRYMEARYGTWAKAKAFWQCKGICANKYGVVVKTHTWW